MTVEIPTNMEISISEIWSSFAISPNNSINGSVIFTDVSGHSISFKLFMYDYRQFNTANLVDHENKPFNPVFVEFRTNDDAIESITIEKRND